MIVPFAGTPGKVVVRRVGIDGISSGPRPVRPPMEAGLTRVRPRPRMAEIGRLAATAERRAVREERPVASVRASSAATAPDRVAVRVARVAPGVISAAAMVPGSRPAPTSVPTSRSLFIRRTRASRSWPTPFASRAAPSSFSTSRSPWWRKTSVSWRWSSATPPAPGPAPRPSKAAPPRRFPA